MLRRWKAQLACGLFVLSLGVTPAAFAQAPRTSPSTKLVRRGVELRLRGNDKRALTLFRRAYELDGSPVALAQMGEAEHALGHFSEAYEHLQQALQKEDPWINKHRSALERSLADTSRKMTRPGAPAEPVGGGLAGRNAGAEHEQPDAPAPGAGLVSTREWDRLIEAERVVGYSAELLSRAESDLARLETEWRERRSASNDAAAQARASINSLERVLAQCESAIASMDLSQLAPLSAEARGED